MSNKLKLFAITAIFVSLTISGCTSNSAVPDAATDKVTPDFNCEILNSYVSANYYPDTWSTYDEMAYFDSALWLSLDPNLAKTYKPILAMRDLYYGSHGDESPDLGSIYVYDLNTPVVVDPPSGMTWKLIEDTELTSEEIEAFHWTSTDDWQPVLDAVEEVCGPIERTYWLDYAFDE
jgi:hypothetical protein